MLLASHSLVGAFCLGHAVFRAFAGEGPLALRHVNLPVLLRAGRLAYAVQRDARTRERLAPPSWRQLVERHAQPWQMDSAQELEGEALRTGLLG